MIQARTFGTLLALGALTALPGCSYLGLGHGGSQYSQAAPASRYTAPAQSAEASEQPVSNVQRPVTTAMIRRVQAHLKRDGLYHGRIDGLWGPESRQAALDFQHHKGLRPTGKIDLPMLQAMNLTNGNQQYGENNPQGSSGYNGGPNPPASDQQMGQATDQSGSNGASGNQQFGQANSGTNNGPIPPSRNFSTGGQNNGGAMHASNSQYQTNNGAPNATGATGGTAANGSNTSSGQGGMTTGNSSANK